MATYIVYPTKEQEKALEAFFTALGISFIKDDDEFSLNATDGLSERKEVQYMRGYLKTDS